MPPALRSGRAPGRESVLARIQSSATAMVSRLWPDFCAIHMAWGATNEPTTPSGYVRLSKLARHPVLALLLQRIVEQESRHFSFYYRQAEARLRRRIAASNARLLVERFWAPVGSYEQPREEVAFLGRYLFSGDEGLAAARKIEQTIGRLPGFDGIALIGRWLEHRASDAADCVEGSEGAPIS